MIISFLNVAKYYKDEPHQNEGLKYLDDNAEKLDQAILTEFAAIFRGERVGGAMPTMPGAGPVTTPDKVVADTTKFNESIRKVTTDFIYKSTEVVKKDIIEGFILPLQETMFKYEVNSPARIIHFLAQLLHESGEFQYTQEIASGADYEGRDDLGNVLPGDGRKFKG